MIKFGTDGWRAIISDEFTFENVRKVARAIALYLINHKLSDRPLIIGYDARFLADKFAEEVAKVMKESDISCLLTEKDTPTPVVAWAVKNMKASGAVMLTASHNPPEYCGIKFIPDYAGPANEMITKEIEENLINPNLEILNKSKNLNPKFERFDPRAAYLSLIKSFIDPTFIKKAKLKIVVDPMYGSGRGYLAKLLEELGCEVESLHDYRDVLFGGRNPEPDNENLEELKKKVVENKAALGLATDGDADRFGMVDETGKFYSANQIIPLLLDYLIEERKFTGSAVRSVATTHLIDRIAAYHKIKVFETPVGFKHIARLMLEQDIIIGGEESGGLSIKGHIPEKDGILANLLIVELLARKKKKLSECWKDLTEKAGVVFEKKSKLSLSAEAKDKLMNKLKNDPPAEIAGLKVKERNLLDGVKFLLEDGSWVLCRPSGTEPLVRVYAESFSPGKAGAIADFIKGLV